MAKSNEPVKFKDQFNALRNLPRFFRLIWQTNKYLAIGNALLRLVKSAIPLAMLYIGKEIIDEVIRLIEVKGGELSYLWLLVGLELALAVLSDLINRGITLMDSLLGDLFANKTSVELIRHATKLDLYTNSRTPIFTTSWNAPAGRRPARTVLMSQVLSQFQDSITILFLGAGLIAFNPLA
jgi:ATP-binding cassette, subfamily B, bacterial